MKRATILVSLSLVIVASLLFASCGSTSTTTTTSAVPTTTASTTTSTAMTTTTNALSTTSTAVTSNATTSVSTTSTGNWWDTLGTPQYGGVLIDHLTSDITVWDDYESTNGQAGFAPYLESLFENDYTVNPSTWDFSTGWIPEQYAAGELVQSYSMPNPYTVICSIRQNVYWQNIAPVSGRQLVANDIVYHFDRMLGLGDGFTTVDPYYVGNASWALLTSVAATDKFTVTFGWKQGTNPVQILTLLQQQGADTEIMAPEAIQAYTTANSAFITSWNQAIGTGPFILTDFVDSSSATYVRNPSYWQTDLRWPQNKLPYLDGEKLLIIPSNSTAEAAMRVGKIDSFASMPVTDALAMLKTNPGMNAKQSPQGNEADLSPNNAVAPFNNPSVRQAIQHAINIPLIASSFFQGYATPWPSSLTQNQMGLGGWGCAYPQWPASVQAQYTYDPTLAKQMLTAAGITTPVTYPLILCTDANSDLYQIVESELAAIGVNLSVTLVAPAPWQSQVITARNYTAFAARNQGFMGVNYDIFHQLVKLTTGYGVNYLNVNDPTINNYYQQAIAAQSVTATAQALHDDNVYIASQNIDISVAQPSTFNMVQPWVQGNPGSATLGDAVLGAGFGGGVPYAVWINPALRSP